MAARGCVRQPFTMSLSNHVPTPRPARRIWIFSALVLAGAAATVLFFLITRSPAQAGGTVTLLFFDRNGNALTPAQVRTVSNNGGAGYNSDFLVHPANLRAISSGPLFTSGTNLAFNIPGQAVALALNWPTLPGGFQLLLVDNGGSGFSTGGTINFTYQAARDVKRKLDAARAERPDYVPSGNFTAAYQAASSQLASVDAYSPESAKGKAGQLALDQLAVAYDALLAEHGPVYAAANKATLAPALGFTIDTVSGYQANLDLAASLAGPFGWVRVVFDAGEPPATYSALVQYAKSRGLKVLGQPVDSTYDRGYTRAQYKQRFIDFITAFPQIDAWEVGNEVNGTWLSSDIALRIADAAAEVKTRAPGKKTLLTFFWQLNTDTVPNSMFNWINTNLPASTRANLDIVTLSQYQEQAPMGVAFDQVMKTLRQEFPSQQIGIGELGYWIPGQQFWWAYNQADPAAAKRAVAQQFYNSAFDFPGSIGGVFWWTFIPDFKTDPALQTVVTRLRDTFLAGGMTPTPYPTITASPTPSPNPSATPSTTPVVSPSPTATPTPTASPTPTPGPSPTSTPGLNVFNGSWALVAQIPAQATFKDFYQVVRVDPGSTCTASVWVKGSGSLELQIWGNARWTQRLASVRINGTGSWTKFTTPAFRVGSRQRVWISFDTAYANAAGTLYLDEVFLGTAGGANRTSNAGFESGNTGWTSTAPAVFSIRQNP